MCPSPVDPELGTRKLLISIVAKKEGRKETWRQGEREDEKEGEGERARRKGVGGRAWLPCAASLAKLCCVFTSLMHLYFLIFFILLLSSPSAA